MSEDVVTVVNNSSITAAAIGKKTTNSMSDDETANANNGIENGAKTALNSEPIDEDSTVTSADDAGLGDNHTAFESTSEKQGDQSSAIVAEETASIESSQKHKAKTVADSATSSSNNNNNSKGRADAAVKDEDNNVSADMDTSKDNGSEDGLPDSAAEKHDANDAIDDEDNRHRHHPDDAAADEEMEEDDSESPEGADDEQRSRSRGGTRRKRTSGVSLNDTNSAVGIGKRPRRRSKSSQPGTNDEESADDEKEKEKILRLSHSSFKPDNDRFCWRCHRECRGSGGILHCAACPRVFHHRCAPTLGSAAGPASPAGESPASTSATADASSSASSSGTTTGGGIVCSDCNRALELETLLAGRPDAEERLGHLADALGILCDVISALPKSEPFREPVSTDVAPDYGMFVCHPTDLSSLRSRALQRDFASVEAFLAEAKWLLHNCVVYNGSQAPITLAAKQLMQAIKREAASLEQCPTCYLYGDRKFTSLCPTAHPLVWARLRHWPQWPGKVVSRRQDGSLEIAFFGTHDRAVLPASCVTFHSPDSGVRGGAAVDPQLELALRELGSHIKNLQGRYGEALQLPAPDTPYSDDLAERLFTGLRPKSASGLSAGFSSSAGAKRPRRSSRASIGVVSGGNDSQQQPPGRPSSRGGGGGGSGGSSSAARGLSPAVEAKSNVESQQSSSVATTSNFCSTGTVDVSQSAQQAHTNTSAASSSTVPKLTSLNASNPATSPLHSNSNNNNNSSSNSNNNSNHHVSNDSASKTVPAVVNKLSIASTTNSASNNASGSDNGTSSTPVSSTTVTTASATDPWLKQMRAMAVRSFSQALEHSLAQLARGCPPNSSSLSTSPTIDLPMEATTLQKPHLQQQQQQQTIAANSAEEINTLKQKLVILNRQHAADRAKLVFRHQLQIHEMEHNHRLAMCEQRAAFDIEKQKVLSDAMHSLESELKRKIDDTKKKQWCAYCRKEAFFYCCWNTSYCDTACQQKHWPQHMATCTQARTTVVPPVAAVNPNNLSAAAAAAAVAAAAAASSAASTVQGGSGSSSASYRQLIGR